MTNKEVQEWLAQYDDDLEIPDHVAIQIVQLASFLLNKSNKTTRSKDND